jgi:ankyrin repeat protein
MSLADAIIYDDEEKVKKLVASGEDVNEQDRFGLRPLIQAVICHKPQVLEFLLASGADIEQADFLNRTALHWAADRNELEMCLYLLKNGANPNKFSAEGQAILVNPILREQVELVDLFVAYKADYQFAQDFINSKLLGHRFELLGEIDIVNSKEQFIPVSFEGFYLEFTSGLIHRSLFNFINSIPGQKYLKHHADIRRVMRALKDAATLAEYAKYKDKTPFMAIIEQTLNAELLLLPVAYRGHAITFVIHKGMLAICNRGVSNQVDTTIIYEVGEPFKLTSVLYKKLLYEYKEQNFMEEELYQELQLKPIATFPTTHQVTGNCSWANVEASVPAMLLMQKLNLKKPDHENIVSYKKEINVLYKAWINWDKDTALDEAIEDFESALGVRQLAKAITLNTILVQRCDPRYKSDIERSKKILDLLTIEEFKFILRNDLRVSIQKKDNSYGKRLLRLFEKCNLDINTLNLTVQTNFNKSNIHSENLVRMTTALHVAALENDLPTVKHLLNDLNFDVDYLDRTGSSALMYAAWKGNIDIVSYLLSKGANPEIKNLKGGHALAYALYAKKTKVIEILQNHLNNKNLQ